jgi:hypothetical protein
MRKKRRQMRDDRKMNKVWVRLSAPALSLKYMSLTRVDLSVCLEQATEPLYFTFLYVLWNFGDNPGLMPACGGGRPKS